MKVGKSKLVELFEALGVGAARKWSLAQLGEKAQKLESYKDPEVDLSDPDQQTLYEDITAAAARGKGVSVEDDVVEANGEADEATPKKKKAKAPTPRPEGPGVIASIVEFLSAASATRPLTKKDIHARLVRRFPERNADSMWTTINIQVPSRLLVDRNVRVEKNDKGYWIGGGAKKPKKGKAAVA
jgi:hypothetical protein